MIFCVLQEELFCKKSGNNGHSVRPQCLPVFPCFFFPLELWEPYSLQQCNPTSGEAPVYPTAEEAQPRQGRLLPARQPKGPQGKERPSKSPDLGSTRFLRTAQGIVCPHSLRKVAQRLTSHRGYFPRGYQPFKSASSAQVLRLLNLLLGTLNLCMLLAVNLHVQSYLLDSHQLSLLWDYSDTSLRRTRLNSTSTLSVVMLIPQHASHI